MARPVVGPSLFRALRRLLRTRAPEPVPAPDHLGYVIADRVFERHHGLGMALAAGWEMGRSLYSRPGFRATAESAVRRAIGLEPENRSFPEKVHAQADWLAEFLRDACHPRVRRVAVDGVPGSGKSTLARLLARRLGLQVRTLDHMNMDRALDLDADGTIFEHHRLLRTQNVDRMDAIIYIDEPVELSKAKVLQRKRGGYLLELMDYDLLKQVGDAAFAAANGQVVRVPNSNVLFKLGRAEGFRIRENVQRTLLGEGLPAHGLSQEAALFLATTRRARDGFLAYHKAGALTPDLVAALHAGLDLGRARR